MLLLIKLSSYLKFINIITNSVWVGDCFIWVSDFSIRIFHANNDKGRQKRKEDRGHGPLCSPWIRPCFCYNHKYTWRSPGNITEILCIILRFSSVGSIRSPEMIFFFCFSFFFFL